MFTIPEQVFTFARNRCSAWAGIRTWYVIEWDGEDLCFGLVSGQDVELGYFALSDISCARGALGLPVERDLYFSPCPLSTARAQHE